jgi:hypothetical protein
VYTDRLPNADSQAKLRLFCESADSDDFGESGTPEQAEPENRKATVPQEAGPAPERLDLPDSHKSIGFINELPEAEEAVGDSAAVPEQAIDGDVSAAAPQAKTKPEKPLGEAANDKQRATDDDPAVLIQRLQRMSSRRKPEQSLDLWSIQKEKSIAGGHAVDDRGAAGSDVNEPAPTPGELLLLLTMLRQLCHLRRHSRSCLI